jgi:hypothetical protein
MTHLLTGYSQQFRDVRSAGVAVRKTSSCPATSALVNEVGKAIRPCGWFLVLEHDAETVALIRTCTAAPGYVPTSLADTAALIRQGRDRISRSALRITPAASLSPGLRMTARLGTRTLIRRVPGTPCRPEPEAIAFVGGTRLGAAFGELAEAAGRGHSGTGGHVMPGKAVERAYTPDEIDRIAKMAEALGFTLDQALAHLGPHTRNIDLNDAVSWLKVSARARDGIVGGYRVMKKWLSCREHDLLRRLLSVEEAREVPNIARRLTALVLLEPALEADDAAVKAALFDWGLWQPAREDRPEKLVTLTSVWLGLSRADGRSIGAMEAPQCHRLRISYLDIPGSGPATSSGSSIYRDSGRPLIPIRQSRRGSGGPSIGGAKPCGIRTTNVGFWITPVFRHG